MSSECIRTAIWRRDSSLCALPSPQGQGAPFRTFATSDSASPACCLMKLCSICSKRPVAGSRSPPTPSKEWLKTALAATGVPLPSNPRDTRELFRQLTQHRHVPAVAAYVNQMDLNDFLHASRDRAEWLQLIYPSLSALRESWLDDNIRVCAVHVTAPAAQSKRRSARPSLLHPGQSSDAAAALDAALSSGQQRKQRLDAFEKALTKAEEALSSLRTSFLELTHIDVPRSAFRTKRRALETSFSRVLSDALVFFRHEDPSKASSFCRTAFCSVSEAVPSVSFVSDSTICFQAERIALASGHVRTLRASRLASSDIQPDVFKSLFGFLGLDLVEAFLDILNQFAIWELLPVFRTRRQLSDQVSARAVPEAHLSRRKLSQLDSILLALFVLRTGVSFRNAAFFFNVSRASAQRAFSTAIIWLYIAMQQMQKFVDEEPAPPESHTHIFRRASPFADLPEVFMILDATEFGVQAFDDLKARRTTYSNYKHKLTIKVLVCLSEIGHISFVSRGYAGNISDNYITDVSNALLRVPRNSACMVDKGFTIAHLAAQHDLHLYTPPRVKDKRLSALGVNLCQLIARRRVQVEIAIGQMRTWRFLCKPVKTSQIDLFSAIIRIIGHLTNATCRPFVPRDSFIPMAEVSSAGDMAQVQDQEVMAAQGGEVAVDEDELVSDVSDFEDLDPPEMEGAYDDHAESYLDESVVNDDEAHDENEDERQSKDLDELTLALSDLVLEPEPPTIVQDVQEPEPQSYDDDTLVRMCSAITSSLERVGAKFDNVQLFVSDDDSEDQ
eukprot:m.178427 g.178427  ORF g.178427 m.178427 type:complete len:785 (+) comp10450_c0_seq1:1494-3848(+)